MKRFFIYLPSWIRIRVDIFGIPDPHKNLCGSETPVSATVFCVVFVKLILVAPCTCLHSWILHS